MSSARGVCGCVVVMCIVLYADGCSGPSCIRNSDCPVSQDCVASVCQLPVAGTSAAGSSGNAAPAGGSSGIAAGTSGATAGTSGQGSLDAGVTDAGKDAQAP